MQVNPAYLPIDMMNLNHLAVNMSFYIALDHSNYINVFSVAECIQCFLTFNSGACMSSCRLCSLTQQHRIWFRPNMEQECLTNIVKHLHIICCDN